MSNLKDTAALLGHEGAAYAYLDERAFNRVWRKARAEIIDACMNFVCTVVRDRNVAPETRHAAVDLIGQINDTERNARTEYKCVERPRLQTERAQLHKVNVQIDSDQDPNVLASKTADILEKLSSNT